MVSLAMSMSGCLNNWLACQKCIECRNLGFSCTFKEVHRKTYHDEGQVLHLTQTKSGKYKSVPYAFVVKAVGCSKLMLLSINQTEKYLLC